MRRFLSLSILTCTVKTYFFKHSHLSSYPQYLQNIYFSSPKKRLQKLAMLFSRSQREEET